MTRLKLLLASTAFLAIATPALANGWLQTPFVQLGANDDGSIDANTAGGFVGIGYKFPGSGSYSDALTPGCPCEAWGVSANGIAGRVGQSVGNSGIGVLASSAGSSTNASAAAVTASFTSNTVLTAVPGLSITQTFTLAASTATGALFMDHVTIANGTGGVATDVRFARAMDWDVPPTPFNEFVTHKGTGTTASLLRSTDNGFSDANPITAMSDAGIMGGSVNTDFTDLGPSDHGSLFIFGFGDLADGATKEFNIFYGAGLNEADALALLAQISPELYSLGQSNSGGGAANGNPTFVFAFNGVGGSVVVPPTTDVPEPGTLALLGSALFGLGALRRRMKRQA